MSQPCPVLTYTHTHAAFTVGNCLMACAPAHAALQLPCKHRDPLYLNLGQNEVVGDYAPPYNGHPPLPPQASWYAGHRQRLVPPPRRVQEALEGVLNWHSYDPQQGFVGFAVNLVALNPRQLGLNLPIEAVVGEQAVCCGM